MVRSIVALLPLVSVIGCSKPAGDVRYAPHDMHAFVPTSSSSPTSGPTDTSSGPTDSTSSTSSTTSSTSSTSSTSTTTTTGDHPIGIDVSHWQGDIDWAAVADDGIAFAYMKASEGTYYTDDSFFGNEDGARSEGLYTGAYHFAIPDDSSGAEQAEYFVDNGGGWTADGETLPGVLDIEWNPYSGNDCYDLSLSELQDWVEDFVTTYESLTGRKPAIYTSRTYWELCIASAGFTDAPLWVADWGGYPPSLPDGWSEYTFWQTDAYGSVDGIGGDCDMDEYGGSPQQLQKFAENP